MRSIAPVPFLAVTFALVGGTLLGLAERLSAQEVGSNATASADFTLAARWAPYQIRDLIHSTTVEPNWIEGTDDFWYEWETSEGKSFFLVDPAAGSKTEIFDNDRIAAELTRITRDPWDGRHLPIRNIRFISEGTLQFDVESSLDDPSREAIEIEREELRLMDEDDEDRQRGSRQPKIVHHFEYDVSTRTVRELDAYEAPDDHPQWASVSPDRAWVAFSRSFNLWMMSYAEYQNILDARRGKTGKELEEAEEDVEVDEIQLTTDGEEHYSYGSAGRGETDNETREEHVKRQDPQISWSQDSQHFALVRRDRREVGDYWVVHVIGNDRPELETYKYDLPGEEEVSQSELWLFDMADRTIDQIDDTPWADQRMGIFSDPTANTEASTVDPEITQWLAPEELMLWRRSRDQHRVDVLAVTPATGAVRVVIEERLNTYVEHQDPYRLANGDLLWWSEADGWAHLYRYAPDGSLVTRLTEGPWHVDGLVGVDEDRGQVFFRANGREPNEDPYYQHLYRVGVDGSGLTLLNPGDFDHRVAMPDSRRFFVDNYARVNTTPASVLYDASGTRILDLEEADFSQLMATGYQFPEPYVVKSADGVTDIYGVMYRPYDFDEGLRYPIVQYVYPGPQTEAVSKFFATNAPEQALAQFGMIVVTVGNRGGHPARSKWYHNYGYGSLRDYGLADKKAAVEQLADRFDFIDAERVGIYGHSGGGFMSTAAMLQYPDFFKVAVSSSGNHDNDVYNQNWSEKHDGVEEVVSDRGDVSFEYDIQRNSDLAANLKGHLLLTTGDVDNNVHHAGTHRMAEALIRANKRFDFFVFPGQRHGYGNMSDYWFWLRAEYFVEHLLGVEANMADIIPLQVERPQSR